MSTKNGWPDLFKGTFSSLFYRFIAYDCPIGTYEENGPPTDVADWLTASMPLYFGKVMIQGVIAKIAEKDRYVIFTYRTNPKLTFILAKSWKLWTKLVSRPTTVLTEAVLLSWPR